MSVLLSEFDVLMIRSGGAECKGVVLSADGRKEAEASRWRGNAKFEMRKSRQTTSTNEQIPNCAWGAVMRIVCGVRLIGRLAFRHDGGLGGGNGIAAPLLTLSSLFVLTFN
jgi:hypothetical protein